MTNLLSNIIARYLSAMEVQPLILVYTLTSLICVFFIILITIQEKIYQYKRARRREARNQIKRHESRLAV